MSRSLRTGRYFAAIYSESACCAARSSPLRHPVATCLPPSRMIQTPTPTLRGHPSVLKLGGVLRPLRLRIGVLMGYAESDRVWASDWPHPTEKNKPDDASARAIRPSRESGLQDIAVRPAHHVGARRDNTHAHPGAKSGDALRFSEFSVTAGMHNERRTRAPN